MIGLVIAGVVVLAMIAGGVALVATKGDDRVTATATGPVGADNARAVSGDGVALRMPDGWTAVPLKPKEMRAFIDRIRKSSPDFARMLSDQMSEAVTSQIRFFAVKRSSVGAGFGTNVNILILPISNVSNDEIVGQAKLELAGVGATGLESGTVQLPQGETVRLAYHLSVAGGGGGRISADGVQYYVRFPDSIAVVTLTSETPDADEPDMRTMASTLRLK